jgi:hypothetical protein
MGNDTALGFKCGHHAWGNDEFRTANHPKTRAKKLNNAATREAHTATALRRA